MKKIALLIMLLTILSKIFGLGRDIALSYFYGTSYISDAYLISITIPSVIFGFIAAGLLAGYIPMYIQIAQSNGKVEADNFTNNIISILFVICTVIILVTLPFTKQIVKVFASGFEGETLDLTIRFTRISLFAIYFTGIVSILTGYLQIKGNYIIPALIGLPLNIFVIASIFLSSKTNVLVLAIGFIIAVASQVLLMIPFMKKNNFKYKSKFDIKDKHLINMGYIALPVILGVSVDQINILIDRTLASQIVIGGVSGLNYASRLNGFVQGMFVWPITTALYPMISKMAAEKNMFGIKTIISEAITGINLLVMPATVGFMVFTVPIVSALFGRGAFDNQAIIMTSHALFFYSIGMIGFGFRDILTKAFYSLQDTKTPMINGMIAVVLNIVLNLILSKYMGVGGLALATSISGIFTTILLFRSLHQKIGQFGMKQISVSFLKILFASLIMGGIAKVSFDYLTTTLSQNLSLLIAISIGAISYFAIIYFMKIEDVDMIVGTIKRKLDRTST